jgi:hypothetical protein
MVESVGCSEAIGNGVFDLFNILSIYEKDK